MAEDVEVPFGDDPGDTAVLLLAAAEELGLDPHVVRTTDGAFLAPAEVVEKAGSKPEPESKTPAKKTAAKK